MELRKAERGPRPLDPNTMQLLRIMTHEIRGPLVSVMAGLKVVLHGSYGTLGAGLSDKLGDLHAHLNRLLGTADEFLEKTWCMADTVLVHLESLNLVDDVLAVVLDELSDEMRAQRILMDRLMEGMPAQTVLAANRLGMKLVFRNLIGNAVHYGGAGCTVLCGYRDQPDHHRLNVYNSGPPIPPANRQTLFTKLGTVEARAAQGKTGLGLGLYLTREIVHAHGGEIWYEAYPDGSNFVFTVPKFPVPPPSGGNDFEI